jgi:hypothetical protein
MNILLKLFGVLLLLCLVLFLFSLSAPKKGCVVYNDGFNTETYCDDVLP